ncbi:ATP-binding cassette, subfamily B, MsbA [Andreprevotia lacus DSM 23236]|jgi:subfamily B ATP-binding cassette protein MsbA|uniref:ATP-binding cassette, subfamily B, MsbA n=1 Tax=Andreprevotia lacus DSM 23236 TaxID=1121001 RepID=A0A1W1XRQ4_9NEIS|nr:lipid A export permease/ATP-binding protein MsbA [Andreprevotia lacus]SMC26660.1 ATP-binding cassette, subfamily B, MsbA [Andreprevotia lacus DSM 23236]
MNSRQLYLRLLGEIKPYWRVILVTISCMAVAALVDGALLSLLQPLVDKTLSKDALVRSAVWVMPAQILVLAVLRLGSNFGNEYTSTWLSARVMHDLREKMFGRYMRLPTRYYDQSSVGVLLSRVTYDVNQIMEAGVQTLTVFCRDSIATAVYLSIMLYQDWRLTLLCLFLLPGVAASIAIVGKRQRRISRETQAAMGDMTRILDESLAGQRVVKLFGGISYEEGRFSLRNRGVKNLSTKQAATAALNSGVIMLLIGITLAVIVYFASLRAQAGGLTPGAFIVFMTAMMALQQPIKNITKINQVMHRGLAAAESVFAVLDQDIEQDKGQTPLARSEGRIDFDHVSFQYGDDGKLALDDINLSVARGETIALVGSSGSGKTTLANLLPRFYEPSGGAIKLDGVALPDYKLADLRRQFAVVSQDVVLFNDTVAANIAYGDPQPDAARVRAAADAAFATDFIAAMPEGFDAMLGENGVRLSGGQRQRLAIARAIYKNAPVLILDEATSALDTESERKVQAALENLMQDRTTIVIAHRLSTIENADRIVVMRRGRIVETGSHAELLAHGGAYAQMHKVQFAEG